MRKCILKLCIVLALCLSLLPLQTLALAIEKSPMSAMLNSENQDSNNYIEDTSCDGPWDEEAELLAVTNDVHGSDFANGELAERLERIFRSGISSCVTPSLPALGGRLNTSTSYKVTFAKETGSYTAKQCVAYAVAAYSYIFGYSADCNPTHNINYSNRVRFTEANAHNSVSFDEFSRWGVRCGAYLRTTNYSSGAYNGNTGHSMLILKYDSSKIYYLEGNGDGNGAIRVVWRTWSDFNKFAFTSKSRYVNSLFQPTESIYGELGSGKYHIDVNGWLDDEDNGKLTGYGTVDVSIKQGSEDWRQVANDWDDYYEEHPSGTEYAISDIKTIGSHSYFGVHNGDLSGRIGDSDAVIQLNFRTNADLGADFYAHIITNSNHTYLTEQDDRNVASLSPSGDVNQIWHFERLENNFYKITSAKDENALDVTWGRTNEVVNVGAVPYHDDSAQKWSLHSIRGQNGAYAISALCTSYVLDTGESTDYGHNAYMQQEYLNWCQLFTIEQVNFRPNEDLGADFYAHIINTSSQAYLTEQDDRNVAALSPSGGYNQIWHFERLQDNLYKITSVKSGNALDVAEGKTDMAVNVGTVLYHDDSAQKWGLCRTDDDAFTVSALCTSYVLDAGGGGGNVYMQEEYRNWCQLFTIQKINFRPNEDIGQDFYARIVNKSNGLQLFNEDNNVTARAALSSLRQVWHFERLEDNFYKITSAYNENSLDVLDYGTESGTNLQAVGYAGNSAQTWSFHAVDGGYLIGAQCTSCVIDTGGNNGNAYMCEEWRNENQIFTIQPASPNLNEDLGQDFYAHIVNKNSQTYLTEQDDKNVAALSPSGGYNQIWHFERLQENLYKITSVKSGNALDVAEGKTDMAVNVGTVPYHDDSAQKWGLCRTEDDAFTVSALCTSYVLDAGGGGGNVYMQEEYRNWCQLFTIQKIESYEPHVPVTGITLNLSEVTLISWPSMKTLSVMFSPENATDKGLTWESSDESVATVTNGIIVSKKSGVTTITARTNDGGYTASCKVTVIEPVTGVSLDKNTLTLQAGDSATLRAIIAPANATNKNVTWESSDSSVVSISGAGTDISVQAQSAGKATITVSTADGNQSASCSVTVNPIPAPISDSTQIVIENQDVSPDSEFTVPVIIRNNPGISGATLAVSYDQSVFTLSEITKASVFETGNYSAYPETGIILWYHTENVTENGTLFTLHFTVKATAASGNYNIAVGLRDGIPANLSNVSSDIVNAEFIPGVMTVTSGIRGDVTGDGVVAINDVVKLARSVAGNITLSAQEKEAADVTGDGIVAINDVVKLARYVAGNIASLQSAEATLFSGSASAVIETASVRAEPGEAVRVPVSITTNPGISGAQLDILFDDNLTLKSIIRGDVLSVGTFNPDVSNGRIQWYYDQANVTDMGVLFTLEFDVSGSAENGNAYAVTVNVKDGITANLSDYDFNIVNAEFKSGKVQIGEAANTVIEQVNRNGSTVTAEIVCADTGATAFCGIYNNSGQFVTVSSREISGASTYSFQFDGYQFDYAKVFLLDSNQRPLCESKRS